MADNYKDNPRFLNGNPRKKSLTSIFEEEDNMGKLLIARRRKNLTQAELAKRIGISNLRVSRYERGETIPKADILIKIANELGVSIDWLMS